jgi:hypothetical protein
MTKKYLILLAVVLLLAFSTASVSLADEVQPGYLIVPESEAGITSASISAPAPEKPSPIEGGQVESLSGSFVVFDPAEGGDACFIPGDIQTFCFTAESYTNDWEYVYNLWEKFPVDWTLNNVYIQGTPVCDNGSWGAFSWSFETAPYEVNLAHPRYQSTTDHCVATYCFDVTSGTGAPDALVSWFWDGDGYGASPHNPCSNDGYTPSGQNACDEMIYPPVAVPSCALDPIMVIPETQQAGGCSAETQEHAMMVLNNTGYDTVVNLSYYVSSGLGECNGPDSILVLDGASVPFVVTFQPFGIADDQVVCNVFAQDSLDPANFDTAWLKKDLVSGFFDSAGWQLENIDGALPTQWGAGVIGTNPSAAGDVGYSIGGLAEGTSVIRPGLQMYDPGTDTWTQLADMLNPRFSPVAGWIDGMLYAAGGYDVAFGATSDLQVYDPVSGSWDNTTYPDMLAMRGGGAGGSGSCSSGSGACLFHVGGGPDGSFANTTLETWEYDPGTMTWTQLDYKPAGSSPDGHILGAGVGCGGYVYVGGDYRGFHEFFRLDATQPSGSQWTQLANIPPAAGSMTPALVCKEDMNAILLIGGDPDGYWGTYNTTIYVYDITGDTWEGPLPQTLNVGQLGSIGLHMDNKVWTFGGTVGSGAIQPVPHESLAQFICSVPQIVVDPLSLETLMPANAAITKSLAVSNVGDSVLAWLIYEASWYDNFDSYVTGSQIHGQGGWKGWFNNPIYGALVSNAQARSAPNSIVIVGASDIVHEYSGYNSGTWTYTTWQYIPSGFSGQSYFILLNSYDEAGIGLNWSTQVNFDSSSGLVTNDGVSAGTLPMVTDEWVELRVEIDLDSDLQTFYYNDQLLYTGTWTGEVSGGGALNIGAVNYYANGVSAIYYDEPSLKGMCDNPEDIPWLSVAPSNGLVSPLVSAIIDVGFDSTGMALGQYTAEVCITNNDPVDPVIPIPLTMTIVAPAIELAKTVGTDPNVCSVTDSLEVPIGAQVTYCYEVTNIGDTLLPVHDLFDSELGELFTGFAFDLPPGASHHVTELAVVTADTTNTATWTAWLEVEGAYIVANDTATVTVYEPFTFIHLPIIFNTSE